MPTCRAKNCTNNLKSGFRFFALPKDIETRKVWIERSGCKATKYSRLCEFHFDDSVFETNREDEWSKLKPNAVPTIFSTIENTGPSREIQLQNADCEAKKKAETKTEEMNLDLIRKCVSHGGYESDDYSNVSPIDDIVECNIVNNVLGCAISYVLRKNHVCRTCLLRITTECNGKYSAYTEALSHWFLENPSPAAFKYATLVEGHLKEHFQKCTSHPHFFKHLVYMIETWVPLSNSRIPKCASCNAFENIVHRYIHIRHLIQLSEMKKKVRKSKKKSFASKTAFRQAINKGFFVIDDGCGKIEVE